MNNSLYLHLPFCKSICPYCDFYRIIYHDNLVDKYLEKLITQIPLGNFPTIYLGGGTPSCLSYQQLETLLRALDKRTTGEYTIECNVEDISEDKLKLFKRYGINRISLGVQSFNTELLNLCKRHYTKDEVIASIKLVKEYFSNYSIDLIYGLPNQSLITWENDLLTTVKLKVPHISLYALTIENRSQWGRDKVKLVSNELYEEYYQLALKLLKDYQHYEISNFALNDALAKHNLVYWHYQDFIGLGAGASGKRGKYRYTNVTNIDDYLNDRGFSEEVSLTKEEEMFEYLMMGFRLKEGIDLKIFSEIFKVDFIKHYSKAIEKNQQALIIKDNSIALKEDYWFISNEILVDFLN